MARDQRYDTEDTVESHLRTVVRSMGGQCLKVRLIRGFPDRVVLLPGGRVLFAELKRPMGGKFEPLQLRWHAKLRALGFHVVVWHTKASVTRDLLET